MNIFEKMKLYFALKKGVANIKEAYMQNHNYFSSEFFATAVPTAVAMWGQVKGFVPQPYATYITIAVPTAYVIGRSIVKAVRAFGEAKAAAAVKPA